MTTASPSPAALDAARKYLPHDECCTHWTKWHVCDCRRDARVVELASAFDAFAAERNTYVIVKEQIGKAVDGQVPITRTYMRLPQEDASDA